MTVVDVPRGSVTSAPGPATASSPASPPPVPALAHLCRPVPPQGAGICPICHGCPHAGYPTCWSCATVMGQVPHPCLRVVPISLYTIPGGLHGPLRRYKDARCQLQRELDTRAVGELLSSFLDRHLSCVAGDAADFDMLTTVPSSAARRGQHPLIQAIETMPWLAARHQSTLVRGPGLLGHARASEDGFEVCRAVDGARILVVDDTFTTGARAESAASALQSCGARVPAIVVVGRVINPSHSALAERWWREHGAAPFHLDRCCLESPET